MLTSSKTETVRIVLLLVCVTTNPLCADPPMASYIFPAGGQRGTTVNVRVGGCALNDSCSFEIDGQNIKTDARFLRVPRTTWFEGPLLNHTDAQSREDYPKDYSGQIAIGEAASEGIRHWRVWTSQGVTPLMKFEIGDLPEIIEQEVDGQPIPERVKLPMTINGRIFPREDVDVWEFIASPNESITCEVNAARLGSQLLAHLEVVDHKGQRIVEAFNNLGSDARLRFTSPEGGVYRLKIRDIRFGGSQSHVYRMTVTNSPYVDAIFPLGGRRGTLSRFEFAGHGLESRLIPLPADKSLPWTRLRVPANVGRCNPVLFPLDDLPEYIEPETSADGTSDTDPAPELPAVLNGRIRRPGEVDSWRFVGKAGDAWDFDLFAARLDSPLDSVLVIMADDGTEVTRSEDMASGETDSRQQFIIPKDGTYIVRIRDQFASRGGDRFAYRLKVTRPTPNFELRLPVDSLNLVRGTEAAVKVAVTRTGGFNGEITLKATNLPPGVAAAPVTIGPTAQDVDMKFRAEAKTPIRLTHVRIEGEATIGAQVAIRPATYSVPMGEPPVNSIALAVALPTPFKYAGHTGIEYIPVGSEFQWHFRLDRGGFQGPIKIELAERQFRHLMGLSADSIVVPAEGNEFDFPIRIPPWSTLGRTGRAVISASGTIVDQDGSEHTVNFSTHNDDDQIVVQASPPLLTIDTSQKSIVAHAGGIVTVPVKIGRNPNLQSSTVRIDLLNAERLSGLTARSCEIPCGQEQGELKLQFTDRSKDLWNAPLVIRASADFKGKTVFAQMPISVVAE